MITLLLIFLISYIILTLRQQKLFSIYLDYLSHNSGDDKKNILSPEKAETEEAKNETDGNDS